MNPLTRITHPQRILNAREISHNPSRTTRWNHLLRSAFLAASATLWTGPALAATGIWSGGSTGATWDTTATNWSGVTGTPWDSSNGPNNIAQFNTASATAGLSGNVYASGILFAQDRNTQPIINGSGTLYLSSTTATLTGSNDYGGTVNVPVVGVSATSQIGTNAGGYGTLTINGGITGTTSLTLGGNHQTLIASGALNITGTITNKSSAGNYSGIYTTISAPIGSGVTNITNDTGTTRLYITNAANSYGTTTINAGNVIFGSTGSIGTGLVTVNAGGAVTLQGATNLAPMLAKIAPASAGAIALDANSSTAVDLTGFANLSLGALSTVTYSGTITSGGTIYRLGGGGGVLTITSAALTGGNDLVVSGSGILTLSGANTYTGTTTLSANSASFLNLGIAENENVAGPIGQQLASAAGTIILNGGGSLQYSTANNFDYSGRFSTAAGQKYNVDTNGRTVTWAANLTSSGGSLSLTRSGTTANTGTLVLTGNNTFSGVTTFNNFAGALSVATIGDGGVAGNLGAAPGAAGNIVFYGRQTSTDKLIYTGVTAGTNRGFTIGQDATAVFDITNAATALTISGVATSGTNTAYLIKRGAGTLVLAGLSSRGSAGYNQVLAGTLQFAKTQAIYTNTSTNWTAAHLAAASGATLAFNVGGSGECTTGNVSTLLTNLAASTGSTNGMNAGSNLGFDTANAAGGPFTITDVIANTIGTAGGTRGLTKLGPNTLVLAAANTYTGPTTVNGGTLALTGSLAAATSMGIAAGATFDVSALTSSAATYTWNTVALKASGTGTGAGTAATVSGTAGGTVSMGSTPITLTWAGSSSGIDTDHPSLTVTGAALALAGNEFTVVTGTALAAGTYTLVSAAVISGGSTVNGTPLYTGGAGVVSGLIGTVSISGNSVILTVSSGVAGALDHFAISTISSPQTAGTVVNGITITAQDYLNATVTSFNGTVTFGGSAGVTGSSAAFASGVLNGVSITPLVAGSSLTFTVTGSARVGSSTFNVNPGPVTAASSTVTAAPTSITADGTTTSTVTVTLKDSNNNAVSGKTVALASSRGSTDTISAASGASNSSGVVTFTVKSSTLGSAVLTATDTTDGVVVTQTAIVGFTSAPTVSAANSTVTASPSAIPADGTTTSTITVTLKDTSNNPVSGKSVTLASSRGPTDSVSAASGASNSSGVVTFTVKSTTAGAPVFTATDTTDNIVVTQTAVVAVNAVAAQSVTALNISAGATGSEILTDGTLVEANHFGGVSDGLSAAASVTLTSGLTFGTSVSHLTTGWSVHSTATDSQGKVPLLTDATTFGQLMRRYFWIAYGGSVSTIKIPGLTQGHTYRLQMISVNPENAGVVVANNPPITWTGTTPSLLTSTWFQEYQGSADASIILSRTAGEINFNAYALHDMSTASSLKNIASMTFPGIGDATMVGTNISITVPFGTSLTALAPAYTLSAGATCLPASGTPRNFTTPQTYTVTAPDSSTKIYTVTVTVAPISSAKDILACSFGALGNALITGNQITITVPTSQALTNLAPTFTISPLASISPVSGSAHDFTSPWTYTVTAQDSSTKAYTVTVQTYQAWQYSASLFILTTPDGANLAAASESDFPLLVRLNSNNFNFAQAKSDGADIRFSTAAGVMLPYQIEQWDPVAGTACVWVKIPAITGNARQEIKMYWGKSDAASESNSANVFNSANGYCSVIHLNETLADELGTVTPADLGTSVATGLIGKGRHFVSGAGISCGNSITTYPYASNPFTSECWFRADAIGGNPLYWGRYATRYNGNTGDGNEVNIYIGSPASIGWASDGPGGATAATVPSVGQWYHVAAVYANGVSQIYVNGNLDGTRTGGATAMSIIQNVQMNIGGWRGGNYAFAGDIDEVRVSKVARSANWMKLQYENQKAMQSLVGPPVQPGGTFSVAPASVTHNEGASTTLTAQAGGAQKIYWTLKQNGTDSVLAVDQFTLGLAAGRVTGSQAYVIELKAIYPTETKTIDIPVTINEYLPDPIFALSGPSTWDGRQTITVTPNISNLAALQAKGVATFNYSWNVAGLAVTKQITPGVLTLTRSQGSGPLTVTLTMDNGGTPVTVTKTITVQEPSTDAWVQRVPDANEKPVTGQFIPRDDTNFGRIYYKGSLSGSPSSVYLKVYTTDTGTDVFYNSYSQPLAGGAYSFTAPVAAGLVTYKVVLGSTTAGVNTDLDTVTNLVCGDAYIVNGQSNAVADNADNPYSSQWIRSFGNMGGGTASGWGNAVRGSNMGDAYRIGYWPMDLAINLVATCNVPICIINGAVGGTRIDQHQANPADHASAGTSYSIYANILNRVAAAKLTHGIRAVLWHQGENNSGAAAPTGDWDYKSYQQYFMDMAAAWKQDYPNIRHYYVYQVWPLPCGMGPKGDQLREAQRTLPRLFSNLSVMSSIGVTESWNARGLCHFDSAGYAQLATFMAPLVKQYTYGISPTAPVSAPNLQRAYFTNSAKTAIALEFDQDMAWTSAVAGNIYLEKTSGKVTSGSASGHVVTLQLGSTTTATTIDYLEDAYWDGSSGKLFGANNIAALTFADVAIQLSSAYANWAANAAQALTAGVNDGLLDDPDHDGIPNLLEFVLGGAPMTASRAILPVLSKAATGIWTFEYDRSALSLPPGTTQIVEYGSNLTGWNQMTIPATSAGNVTITPGTTSDHVKVTLPDIGAKGFVRLKVSQ